MRFLVLFVVASMLVLGSGCGSSHGPLTPVGPGGTTGDTGGGTPPPPPPATQPPTITASTSPDTISAGQSSTLSWTSTNASSVTISGIDGAQPVNGSIKVSPTQSTSYTLTATGPGGTATFTAFVTVMQAAAPAITSFTVQPSSVTKGQPVTFTWATQNAAEVMIEGIGNLPASGTLNFTPQASGDFTLTAISADETQSAKSTVHVDVLTSAVIKTFTATPQQITSGQQSVLNWEVQGATSVKLNGADQPLTGSTTVTPTTTTTYSLVATGADNATVQQDLIVTVTTPTATGLKKINHILFMVQENRSFDQYFGKLNDYRVKQGLSPDIDGIPADASNKSYDETFDVKPFHLRTQCMENTTPSWDDAHPQRNRHHPACTIDSCSPALMDGFVRDAAAIARINGYFDTEGHRTMGYYTEQDLPYYYFMATNFATSNRFFAPVMANTQPNLLFLFAATSGGWISQPTSTLPDKTIFQLLEEAGISWKFYMPATTESNVVFTFQPFTSQHKDKFVPMQQYFDDLNNGTLPAVAFIASKAGLDEHPGPANLKYDPSQPTNGVGTKMQWGAIYVSNIINSLMQSSAWKDSIFIWGFDEWGGTYDHVGPMKTVPPDDRPPRFQTNPDGSNAQTPGDFSYTGFRIPMMVISPYTKKGYVSNTAMDSTAILKLIEERFDLPSLTRRDAAQPSMTEFFDFDNPSWMTPPKPPAQPGNMLCDRTQIP